MPGPLRPKDEPSTHPTTSRARLRSRSNNTIGDQSPSSSSSSEEGESSSTTIYTTPVTTEQEGLNSNEQGNNNGDRGDHMSTSPATMVDVLHQQHPLQQEGWQHNLLRNQQIPSLRTLQQEGWQRNLQQNQQIPSLRTPRLESSSALLTRSQVRQVHSTSTSGESGDSGSLRRRLIRIIDEALEVLSEDDDGNDNQIAEQQQDLTHPPQ